MYIFQVKNKIGKLNCVLSRLNKKDCRLMDCAELLRARQPQDWISVQLESEMINLLSESI